MAAELTLALFEPHVGAAFRIVAPNGDSVEVRLEEAKSLAERVDLPEGLREPFHLLFRAPTELSMEQGSYGVEHSDLGTHDMFLVPILTPEPQKGPLIEAVFA